MSKNTKIVFAILFVVAVLLCGSLSATGKEPLEEGIITQTAKVLFFKNATGNLSAIIIPSTSDGSYPRSGRITCNVIDKKIAETYAGKIAGNREFEGYFTATYKKTEEDKKSPILHYKGELLKLEPWNPPFAGKK